MKVLKYISMFAAAALLMTSCHEDEKVMALPADEVSAPVMNTLSNIVVDDATLQNVPITNTSFSEVTDVTIANHKVYICYVTEVTVSGLEIY